PPGTTPRPPPPGAPQPRGAAGRSVPRSAAVPAGRRPAFDAHRLPHLDEGAQPDCLLIAIATYQLLAMCPESTHDILPLYPVDAAKRGIKLVPAVSGDPSTACAGRSRQGPRRRSHGQPQTGPAVCPISGAGRGAAPATVMTLFSARKRQILPHATGREP